MRSLGLINEEPLAFFIRQGQRFGGYVWRQVAAHRLVRRLCVACDDVHICLECLEALLVDAEPVNPAAQPAAACLPASSDAWRCGGSGICRSLAGRGNFAA